MKIEEKDIDNIWSQQDKGTLDVLRPVFEDRIISRRTDVVWTPIARSRRPVSVQTPAQTSKPKYEK